MNLLMIHGRSQGGKNPAKLQAEWLKALDIGLKKSKLTLPSNVKVQFPYYATELDNFVKKFELPTGRGLVAKGGKTADDYAQFRAAVAEEIRKKAKIPVAKVEKEAGKTVAKEKGPQNWKWVLATLKVIDKHVKGAGSWTIEKFLRDVFLYTQRDVVRQAIDTIVMDKMTDAPTVIVGHSLGSVVAYSVAVNRVPSVTTLLLTVGSPLGLRAVRDHLVPLQNPSGNHGWYNAYDPRDVVALYPLNQANFGVSPAITNHGKVNNATSNRHGIVGYLDDKLVAKMIHQCLTA